MIAKGSRIKLVKPMGMFNKVGEICEVVNVNEDAVITFKCSFGMGCMSYDELDRYFEVEGANVSKEKKKPKRKWSDWKYDTFIYYDFNGTNHTIPVKYRTNGKTIDLRTDWKYVTEDKPNLRAKASCNKNDKFDFDTGLDIADNRMQIKYLQRLLEDELDDM